MGYIGSSVAWMFIDKGHDVTIIDNLIRAKFQTYQKKVNLLDQILQILIS